MPSYLLSGNRLVLAADNRVPHFIFWGPTWLSCELRCCLCGKRIFDPIWLVGQILLRCPRCKRTMLLEFRPGWDLDYVMTLT